MTFSLTIPSFGNVLAEFDGQIPGTDLFTIVRSVQWDSFVIRRSFSDEGVHYVFGGTASAAGLPRLYFETLRHPNQRDGLFDKVTLTLRTGDRLFGSSEKATIEHVFWLNGAQQVCSMGIREHTTSAGIEVRVPIYGSPQGYVVRPGVYYSWNGFYADMIVRRNKCGTPIRKPNSNYFAIDKKKAGALLCFEKGEHSEIFRSLMFLSAAVYDYIGGATTPRMPDLYTASKTLAKMVTPPNTYWGD